MRSPRLPVAIGAASVLVVLAFVVAVGVTRDPDVWYGVGAVYALALVLTGGVWYWRGGSLGFPAAVAIAAVVVVALVPLYPRLFVVGDPSPSLLPGWSLLPAHLQRFVPVAFMLPLGAAATRRQRLGVVAAMLLAGLYKLFDWFVLHPEWFDPFWTTPLSLVVGTGGWFVFYAAAGGPLFVLGYRLARGDGPLQYAARRPRAPDAG